MIEEPWENLQRLMHDRGIQREKSGQEIEMKDKRGRIVSGEEKGLGGHPAKSLIFLARPARFELATYGFVVP